MDIFPSSKDGINLLRLIGAKNTQPIFTITSFQEKRESCIDENVNVCLVLQLTDMDFSSKIMNVVHSLLGSVERSENLLFTPNVDKVPVTKSKVPLKKPNILLADDSVVCSKIIAQFLRTAGYYVVVSNNGENALERLRSKGNTFDLLIIDLMMPSLSGIEACKIVKNDARINLPVIIMSCTDELKLSCLLSADAFLSKPFSKVT